MNTFQAIATLLFFIGAIVAAVMIYVRHGLSWTAVLSPLLIWGIAFLLLWVGNQFAAKPMQTQAAGLAGQTQNMVSDVLPALVSPAQQSGSANSDAGAGADVFGSQPDVFSGGGQNETVQPTSVAQQPAAVYVQPAAQPFQMMRYKMATDQQITLRDAAGTVTTTTVATDGIVCVDAWYDPQWLRGCESQTGQSVMYTSLFTGLPAYNQQGVVTTSQGGQSNTQWGGKARPPYNDPAIVNQVACFNNGETIVQMLLANHIPTGVVVQVVNTKGAWAIFTGAPNEKWQVTVTFPSQQVAPVTISTNGVTGRAVKTAIGGDTVTGGASWPLYQMQPDGTPVEPLNCRWP